MQTNDHKPRRDFIKILSVSLAAMSAIPFMKFKKSGHQPEQPHRSLSRAEANEIISKGDFPVLKSLAPEPAPSGKMNITD